MKLKSTSLTLELKAIPLPIFKMPTSGTCFGGISRIDRLDCNTSRFPFILQELFELVESPRVKVSSLSPSVLSRLSDSSKVFKCNSWPRIFQSLVHDSLRNAVISIGLKPLLFTAKAFQGAFSTLCLFRLKALANSPIVVFPVFNFTSSKEFTYRSNGYKPLTHVAANDSSHIFKIRDSDCFRNGNVEENPFPASNQSRCSYIPTISEIFRLVGTKHVRGFNSAANSGNAYGLTLRDESEIPASYTPFKKNAGGFEGCQMPIPVRFHRGVRRSNLLDSRASHLGSERKASANISVGKPMQSKPIRKVFTKGYFAQVVTGLSKTINRFSQGFWRIRQLQRYCASDLLIHYNLLYHILGGKSNNLRKEVCRNSPVA